jgi:penicillin G amidase
MDLLRRKTIGRLAEIFGVNALKLDRWNRVMGFDRLASTIVSSLPATQRQLLEAYAAGVNQAMAAAPILPIEFTLLRYDPRLGGRTIASSLCSECRLSCLGQPTRSGPRR